MNYYRIAQGKYIKAMRIAKLLRYIPGIKMIGVCNTLSYNKAKPDSDIDLFIITSQGRIWAVRFFSLFLLTLLNLRPRIMLGQGKGPIGRGLGIVNKDKICLGFFISQDNLNLQKYKICIQDSYLSFWIQQVKPLYIEQTLYKQFVQSNLWFYNFSGPTQASEMPFYISNYKRRLRPLLIKPILNLLITSLDEKIYKYLQLKIMPSAIKEIACAWDTRVIISDKILKFHLNDQRLSLQNHLNNL